MEHIPTRVISIASGKGGVGKTSVTVNLAFALAARGNRVCLLDADLGLSNVDLLLGVTPGYTLEDVLFSGLPMERAVLSVARNVDMVSGSSGVARMAELSREKRHLLVDQFRKFDAYDYLLIDNSPGITAQIVSLCLSSREILMVCNPDAASITDAYALMKVLRENGLWWQPLLLVNRAKSAALARRIYERVRDTARHHMGIGVGFMGCLPEDDNVADAALLQQPAVDIHPDSPFAQAVRATAAVLDRYTRNRKGEGVAPGEFWDNSVMRLQLSPRLNAAAADAGSRPESSDPMRASLAAISTDLEQLARHLSAIKASPPESSTEQVDTARQTLSVARARLAAALQRAGGAPDRQRPDPAPRFSGKAPARSVTAPLTADPEPGAANTTEGSPPASSVQGSEKKSPQASRTVSAAVPRRKGAGKAVPQTGVLRSSGPAAKPDKAASASSQIKAQSSAAESLRPSVRSASEASATASRSGEKPSALIVCPDDQLRAVLADIASEAGLHPVTAHPGASDWQGWDRISPSAHRLCLISWDRAASAGLASLISRANGTPIIHVDGGFGHPHAVLSADSGRVVTVGKPFSVEKLIAALRSLAA